MFVCACALCEGGAGRVTGGPDGAGAGHRGAGGLSLPTTCRVGRGGCPPSGHQPNSVSSPPRGSGDLCLWRYEKDGRNKVLK